MKKLLLPYDYTELTLDSGDYIQIFDHMNGITNNDNEILRYLNLQGKNLNILTEYSFSKNFKNKYQNLNIIFNINYKERRIFCHFYNFQKVKSQNINALCSCFNGGNHVSRQLLVAGLYKFGLYSKETCSKTFSITVDQLDGHLEALSNRLVYNHCLVDRTTEFEYFCLSKNSFKYTRFDHLSNLKVLEPIINSCFINIISETMATSEVPFVTEKFLYPVVCKRPWIGYAQPGWHAQLRDLYGFQLFDEIIDYSFDSIVNPVERLIKMLYEVKKFETVRMEQLNEYIYFDLADKLDYNYNHYMSKNWKVHVESSPNRM